MMKMFDKRDLKLIEEIKKTPEQELSGLVAKIKHATHIMEGLDMIETSTKVSIPYPNNLIVETISHYERANTLLSNYKISNARNIDLMPELCNKTYQKLKKLQEKHNLYD